MRYLISIIATIALLAQPLAVWAETTQDLQNQIKEKQTQIQELETQIAQYRQMLKEQKNQSATLQQQISRIETQIKKLQAEIYLTQTKISETSLSIKTLNSDIQTKSIELERQKNSLAQIIRAIDEYDQESPFSLVLNNDNFSDFLNQVQYLTNLQDTVQLKLTEVKKLKEEMEAQKTEQEDHKAALEDLRQQLGGQSLVLASQKNVQNDLLSATKLKEKQYQATVDELQKQREQIEREIGSLEDKLRLMIDPDSIPPARSGVLAWPIKNIITQGYGPTSQTGFTNPVYTFHNGIDIDTEIGDPIRAALEGTIAGVGDNGKYAYGKWIAVKHENGLTTMYAHLSVQSVHVGQKVATGEIIGYAGNTGYSTGSHLHFTVYATNTFYTEQKWYGLLPLGGSINPLNYL